LERFVTLFQEGVVNFICDPPVPTRETAAATEYLMSESSEVGIDCGNFLKELVLTYEEALPYLAEMFPRQETEVNQACHHVLQTAYAVVCEGFLARKKHQSSKGGKGFLKGSPKESSRGVGEGGDLVNGSDSEWLFQMLHALSSVTEQETSNCEHRGYLVAHLCSEFRLLDKLDSVVEPASFESMQVAHLRNIVTQILPSPLLPPPPPLLPTANNATNHHRHSAMSDVELHACSDVSVHQNAGTAKSDSKTIDSKTIDSKAIAEVQEVFPHLGDGYVHRCLLAFDRRPDLVVNALLEDNLPPDLKGLNPSAGLEEVGAAGRRNPGDSAPMLPPAPMPMPPRPSHPSHNASLGNEDGIQTRDPTAPTDAKAKSGTKMSASSRNVFDGDELDTADKLDPKRIWVGKKRQPIKYQHTGFDGDQELQQRFEHFDTLDNEYDDDYDDQWDEEGMWGVGVPDQGSQQDLEEIAKYNAQLKKKEEEEAFWQQMRNTNRDRERDRASSGKEESIESSHSSTSTPQQGHQISKKMGENRSSNGNNTTGGRHKRVTGQTSAPNPERTTRQRALHNRQKASRANHNRKQGAARKQARAGGGV